MTTTIYVLKLEGGKYYVGRTNKKVVKRFKEHKAGKSSAWTRKYKPIGIEKIDLDGDKFDEDKLTKQYMEKYGIGNVRGGTYCQITLSSETIEMISKELKGGTNKCYNCGETGHYEQNCPNKNLPFSNKRWKKKMPNGGWVKKASGKWEKIKTKHCTRCNRDGHTVSQCYATTKIVDESDDESDDESNNYCQRSQKCYKCGKYGHYASNCYSRRYNRKYY